MTIGIIGEGAIGSYVRAHLSGVSVALVRPARAGPGRVTSAEALPGEVTLMLDCAGHAALAEHGPTILARGIDLVTVSLGALADDALHDRLREAARRGGARLHLASGAIGALDCLAAARVGGLERVTYTGRKPPAGWRGSPAEDALDLDRLDAPATHFEGTARAAALAYPKNANVAAAVALAGAGFDATQVRLIADPEAPGNVHEIAAEGAFGRFDFRIEGRALPDNPRSAALAAMSVVATVLRQRAPVAIG
ncbi:aspartate dehydrogenase [Jannaschia formosa]|uniref:aspartate dehydrogenase n=1 Tax=Jannaschia formosa TaxID=2259592 RepID=UPI000E1C0BD2|nr:aspartate dehydrogenase [Jannaschia formosa]TFL19053.1 aspartate dehydrogenase [Jannaschia formosa]